MTRRSWVFLIAIIFLLIFFHGSGPFYLDLSEFNPVFGYEASSTTFFLRGAGLTNMSNTGSSSTSFVVNPAGGQAIIGRASSSASFISLKGIINAIFRSFIPKYEQIHYHWRNDDGTEATATSMTGGTQDTVISGLAKNTVKRIRMEISNEGGIDAIAAQQFRVEYKLKSGDCTTGTYTDVGAVGGDWDMGASSLTEAADTTNIAVSTGGLTDENNSFLTPNSGQRETTSQTGNLTVENNKFVEAEYAVQALNAATDSGVYCFRLTNAGSTTNFTYTRFPEVTLAAGAASITLTIDAGGTIEFGTLNPGTRKTATIRLKIDTNNTSGYTISSGRQRSSPATTLASSASPASINISDTGGGIDVFDGLSSCTTAPDVTAAWVDLGSTGLGFTNWAADIQKSTTCWGSGTTEISTSNKYGAFQASSGASVFLSTTSNSPNPSYASVGLSLDVTSVDRSTNYTGQIVFTATAPP